MKALLKKFIATFGAFALLTVPTLALVTVPAHAQTDDCTSTSTANTIGGCVCHGVVSTGADGCNDTDSDNSFSGLAKKIINIFSIVVGAVSVIMIIIGGFRYIISGGDSNGVSGAKNTILYAIVGLVIVLFAQVIVRFVLSNTTS